LKKLLAQGCEIKGGEYNMRKKIFLSLSLGWLLVVAMACAQAKTQSPMIGQEPVTGGTNSGERPPSQQGQIVQPAQSSPRVVKIAEILSQPENFTKGKVIIEGKIISQCGAGCWFTINDDTATIYVDLAPSNLTIPQKRGAFARVHGTVIRKGSDIYIIGEKVEF
jgi:uncharacterized protein YdeI (BOF family)